MTFWLNGALWVNSLAEGQECPHRWLEWFWCNFCFLTILLFNALPLLLTILRIFKLSWLQRFLWMLGRILGRGFIEARLSWRPRNLVDIWHEA